MQHSRQIKRQFRLVDTPTQTRLRSAEFMKGFFYEDHQLVRVVRSSVGHRSFGLIPYSFVGVEFGSIRRQGFEPQSVGGPKKGTNRLPLMAASVVPDDGDRPSDMTEKVPEEVGSFDIIEVRVRQTPEEKSHPMTAGTHGKSGDDRDPFMLLVAFEDRGDASEPPCSSDRRFQEEPRFVDEDDVRPQVFGVFFILGHSSVFHCSIRSSFRSRALRSGFWQLRPIVWRMRPTWLRSYDMPNRFSMTSATREVVQSSVRYPAAMAPLRIIDPSVFFCRSFSREGRPGEARTVKTPSPSLSLWSLHRMTELAGHPSCLAASFRLRPSSMRLRAFLRLSASTSAEPFGRILSSSDEDALLHYLCRSQ